MAEIRNSIENFEMIFDHELLRKAEACRPRLKCRDVVAERVVEIISENGKWNTVDVPVPRVGSVIFDFGTHMVGSVSFTVRPVGSPPDAPAYLRIKLGEMPCEIGEDSAGYKGSISSSWIQEEFLHIDVLPAEVSLPRRYAFRYMEVKVLDTSPKYQVVIENPVCHVVTSADHARLLPPPEDLPGRLRELDRIAVKTLEDCMQEVFEDGPKRDRRLWIGDLRLQAQANYLTFRNLDLVKRCLYLFAGVTQNEGHVGACMFTQPKVIVDDTSLFDYGLFFVSCLYDYYQETKDHQVLEELSKTAFQQIDLAEGQLDDKALVVEPEGWWCFLDWNDDLNKQAGAQGVFIYTLRQASILAEVIGDTERRQYYQHLMQKLIDAAEIYLWDEAQGFYVSGPKKQISYASQVWLILAGACGEERSKKILKRLLFNGNEIKMITPYMHHHFVEAMMQNGMKLEAFRYLERYWGAMADDGADCFYEIFDMENPDASPYGSSIINSYCHAWSCGPAYFIRKYWNDLNHSQRAEFMYLKAETKQDR